MALSPDSKEHNGVGAGGSSISGNLSYFSYPMKYAVSSALRRLSSDPASTFRTATQRFTSTKSSRKNSPERGNTYTDPSEKSYASRAAQPPPLTPLSLTGFRDSSSRSAQVLDRQLAEEIRLLVPARLQLCEEWRLAFSLEQDGASLKTLFDKAEDLRGRRVGCVLVVKDASATGGVFGAYLSDPPRPSNGHYYGTGECFLWRASVLSSHAPISSLALPPRPSEDTSHYEQRAVTIGSPTRLRRPSHAFSPAEAQSRPNRDEDLISFDSDPEPEEPAQNGDAAEEDDWGDFHAGDTPAAESAPFDLPSHDSSNTADSVSHSSNHSSTQSHSSIQTITPSHPSSHYSTQPSTQPSTQSSRTQAPSPANPSIPHHLTSPDRRGNSSGNSNEPGTSTPQRIRFKAFPYSGLNDYMIFCEQSFLSVGGGDGRYGLFLDGSLEKGLSGKCPTFGNEVLSEEGGKFDVLGVELWVIGS